MNIILQLAVLVSVGMIAYALYGIFSSGGSDKKARAKNRFGPPREPEVSLQEQKIQRLEGQVNFLEKELEMAKSEHEKEKQKFEIARQNDSKLREELSRRQEWVVKSEEMLNKVKEESLDLKKKFIAKEKETQDVFSSGVNLNKQIREQNEKLLLQDKELKDRSDKIEAQKHQLEKAANDKNALQELIAEFKKKEKVSEWVPKAEFNRLNEEYTELETELERKEEKLRTLVEELLEVKNKLINQVKVNDLEAAQPREKEQPQSVEPEKESAAQKTAIAPSRTRKERSTSAVKSTCPGVSMIVILCSFQKQVVAAAVMVMPRSCSCFIQSICAFPSWTSPILWDLPV